MNARIGIEYVRPSSIAQALREMSVEGTAAIGGGTMVLPRLDTGSLVAGRVVDLGCLSELARLVPNGDTVSIGAAVTYSQMLEAEAGICPPLLHQLAATITGGPQLRRQGTLGGSACYANPASDAPGALVALNAQLTLESLRGQRYLPASAFFLGYFKTALAPDEILIAMDVPVAQNPVFWGYDKVKISESSWPIATASAWLRPDTEGNGGLAVVTIGAAVAVPISSPALHIADRRRLREDDRIRLHESINAAAPEWFEDELADAGYRRRIAPVVAWRALENACRRSLS